VVFTHWNNCNFPSVCYDSFFLGAFAWRGKKKTLLCMIKLLFVVFGNSPLHYRFCMHVQKSNWNPFSLFSLGVMHLWIPRFYFFIFFKLWKCPHYMVKFLNQKKKKTRELRWEISNCGFAICEFRIQLFFLMPRIFFSFFFTVPKLGLLDSHTTPPFWLVKGTEMRLKKASWKPLGATSIIPVWKDLD
jgi:hypothetical protein